MRRKGIIRFVLAASLVFLAGGCACMTPGKLEWVQPASDKRYAGNVYLLRGFIGIWSYGVDHMGDRINEAGIRAQVYQEDQWQQVCDTLIDTYRNNPNHEPLVLIGHSYGADDALRIAKQLEGRNLTIDLLITLDPVTPPKVPANIKLCYNIYQPNLWDDLPFFRGIALEAEKPEAGNLQNVNIRTDRRDLLEPGTDHFNIEKNPRIHAEVVKKIKEVCPPRERWVAQRNQTRQTAGMRAEPEAATASPAPSMGSQMP